MDTLGLKVDFDFFKKRLNLAYDFEHRRAEAEDFLRCKLDNLPLDLYTEELALWDKILTTNRGRAFFGAFLFDYTHDVVDEESQLEYDYREEGDFMFTTEICTCIDNNWLRTAWNHLLYLEDVK